jgi:hypothetical protein
MPRQSELLEAAYSKMCVRCGLREFCHPSPNDLNCEAVTSCLYQPATVVTADHPKELGHYKFEYSELLTMQMGTEELKCTLMNRAFGILKIRGLLGEPIPEQWFGTVTTAASGYIVRLYDKEVFLP